MKMGGGGGEIINYIVPSSHRTICVTGVAVFFTVWSIV